MSGKSHFHVIQKCPARKDSRGAVRATHAITFPRVLQNCQKAVKVNINATSIAERRVFVKGEFVKVWLTALLSKGIKGFTRFSW